MILTLLSEELRWAVVFKLLPRSGVPKGMCRHATLRKGGDRGF
jgi:hypothetical protein